MSEFANGNTPANELQIYTWLDASLKELTSLIKDVNPETRRKVNEMQKRVLSSPLKCFNFILGNLF